MFIYIYITVTVGLKLDNEKEGSVQHHGGESCVGSYVSDESGNDTVEVAEILNVAEASNAVILPIEFHEKYHDKLVTLNFDLKFEKKFDDLVGGFYMSRRIYFNLKDSLTTIYDSTKSTKTKVQKSYRPQ